MLFSWRKHEHRSQIVSEPFPTEWNGILKRNVHHDNQLSVQEKEKLRDDLRILISEKNWEGCDGLTITDEIKVTIAGLASLLLLSFEDRYFDMVQSILVYPHPYVRTGHTPLGGGIVIEGESHREGETSYRGPVILSWPDSLAGGHGQAHGSNLVLHEFAHQLDMENGRDVDGTPLLETQEQYGRWQNVMEVEFTRLENDCRNDHRTLIDCYGTTNPAEFFAVCTECFFESSQKMELQHTELYAILKDFYKQDPAHRSS
jgi:Mlc titration factor MtfA (ptsG expression regulator)